MITTVRTHCVKCNTDVRLPTADITLKVCQHAPLSYYRFVCPSCGSPNHIPADDRVVSLLMSGGVEAEPWEVPAEALEPKAGEPISYDDVLDFVQELETKQEWWAEL